MKIEEYKTIEEKRQFFTNGHVKIDINLNQIFEKIEGLQKLGNSFFYRGCCEAKYKMYSSAQRMYTSQELYKQAPQENINEHFGKFITELIESCKKWNNGVVKKLLVQSGIDENNALAYLSYMQHYGVPTPFLDFTFNPYVALFFAVDNIIYTPSDKEIDNYFSFYYTYKDATVFKACEYAFSVNSQNGDFSYCTIAKNNMNIFVPENEIYKIINSVNIINQQGLFLYNNHNSHPLEKVYSDHITETRKEIGQEKIDEVLILKNVLSCFNIHKSLAPAIKERLAEEGITKNYIYPDSMNFKENVTNEGIYKCLTLNK